MLRSFDGERSGRPRSEALYKRLLMHEPFDAPLSRIRHLSAVVLLGDIRTYTFECRPQIPEPAEHGLAGVMEWVVAEAEGAEVWCHITLAQHHHQLLQRRVVISEQRELRLLRGRQQRRRGPLYRGAARTPLASMAAVERLSS